MRILFASRRPAYPFFQGGAERSFYELARALAAAGHPIAMLGECRSELDGLHNLDDFFAGSEVVEQRWEIETVVVQGRQMPSRQVLVLQLPGTFEILHTFLADYRRLLEDVVRGFQPDVICTQLEGSLEVVEFCGCSDARILHFVRDAYYPFNFHVLADVPGGQPAPQCIANSHYTADFLRARLGVEAQVLYPIVRADRTSGDEGRNRGGHRVLFINPAPLKGGELMFEVAQRLNDVQFLVLPGWAAQVPERWHQLPNVETRSWPVLDMDAAYRSADLVVVPTQHSEGFGRVAIEAQLCGTPVLASHHSGLAEILADSALWVDDYREVDAWVHAIREALAAPRRLAHLARDGRANAQRFGPQPIREAFEKIVRDLEIRPHRPTGS